jgi:hypothetical protein
MGRLGGAGWIRPCPLGHRDPNRLGKLADLDGASEILAGFEPEAPVRWATRSKPLFVRTRPSDQSEIFFLYSINWPPG